MNNAVHHRHFIQFLLSFSVSLLIFFYTGGPRPVQAAERYAVLITLGVNDESGRDWSGSLSVSDGRVISLRGHQFDNNDAILSNTTWRANSIWKISWRQQLWNKTVRPPGVICTVEAPGSARLRVKTPAGKFDVPLQDLHYGVDKLFLDGAVTVAKIPVTEQISAAPGFDDYPAIATGPDEQVAAAWVSYVQGDGDRILLKRKLTNGWSASVQMNALTGDVRKVAIGYQGETLWVIWSENRAGNWEIVARSWKDGTLGREQLLSNAPGTDCDPVAASRGDELYLAWQSFRAGNADIMLTRCVDGIWQETSPVTTYPANDWAPAIATTSERVYVVWDSYRWGNYDVYLAEVNPTDMSVRTLSVTDSENFEGRATIASDGNNGVWIAWEDGGAKWGKDSPGRLGWSSGGFKRSLIGTPAPPRHGLHNQDKFIGLVHYQQGQMTRPVQSVRDALPEPMKPQHELPQMTVDQSGRPWLFFRHGWTAAPVGGRTKQWTAFAIRYESDQWSAPILLPMEGRNNHQTVIAQDIAGQLHVAYVVDGRVSSPGTYPNATAPRLLSDHGVNEIRYGMIKPGVSQSVVLRETNYPEPNPAGNNVDRTRFRYPIQYEGKTLSVYWGDLHRHTEISHDGGDDGTLDDLYRYAIDAAQLDFIATTDHDYGGDDLGEAQFSNWYEQWRTDKLADLYLVPGLMSPLFGYERSMRWPMGHRNVIRRTRGFPNVTNNWYMNRRPPEDDEERLWTALRAQGGDAITIPHSSASSMGTDWRISDESYDRMVEIYQGDRNSYERWDGPKAPRDRNKWKDGFISNALSKGYRFGFIASSDHESTHISFAAVYSPDGSRDAVFDGMQVRHTYAATDKIGIDFRLNGRLMGEAFATDDRPVVSVKVVGTDKIQWVDVIRDNEVIYQISPGSMEAGFTFVDFTAEPGEHFYYARVFQEDEAMAWASPVWVTIRQ
jgi:hypothetical protein